MDAADPGAGFVDLTILRLQLSDQRRDTALATRWLDPDDRELLALWWLEAAGETLGALRHRVRLTRRRLRRQAPRRQQRTRLDGDPPHRHAPGCGRVHEGRLDPGRQTGPAHRRAGHGPRQRPHSPLGTDRLLVSWEDVLNASCNAGTCAGAFGGTRLRIIGWSGKALAADQVVDARIAGEMAVLPNGSLVWSYVQATPDYRSPLSGAPTSSTLTIAELG